MRDLTSALAAQQLDVRRFQRCVVKVAASNKLTVALDDDSELVDVPALSVNPTYAVNDLVILARDATGPFVIGRLGSVPASGPTAPSTPPPVKPPSTTSQRTKTILPSSTSSYRATQGWRPSGDDTIRQGDYNGQGPNQGCAFYGQQLVGLGADLTKPRSIVLTYHRQQGGVFAAQAPTVWTLAQGSRPAGAPTRLTSVGGKAVAVGRTEWFALPGGMVDELLDGTARGLGVYVGGASPYIVLSGRSDSSVSFSVKATYYA